MLDTINESLRERFYHNPAIEDAMKSYIEKIQDNKISSDVAAKELLSIFDNNQ